MASGGESACARFGTAGLEGNPIGIHNAFLVLISVVAGLDMCMQSEALVGTIALCATGVYYIVLSLFKGRLQKQFSFWMKKRVESRG